MTVDYKNATSEDFASPEWQHNAALNEPLTWLWSSENLEVSASILREKIDEYYSTHDNEHIGKDVIRPYYMLVGFALECLLKGIIVAKGENIIQNGKIKFVEGSSQHNLIKLADRAGITYSNGEENILKALTENIEWAGRYPTPQRWTQKYKKLESGEATMQIITEGYSNAIYLLWTSYTRGLS